MRAQLVSLDNAPPVDLVKDLTLVGRTEGCDVRLEHKSVSKMHCVIVKTDGLLLLRDLGSTNGTRVNGQRVRRAALLPNDQVTIATYKFRVAFGPDAAPPPPQPEEATQHIDAGEMARLMRPADADAEKDSVPELPAMPPVRTNLLPDVYPDEAHSGERKA
jgi:pSer/pThr/pTyr-binding forkhead associated (FHA) protein